MSGIVDPIFFAEDYGITKTQTVSCLHHTSSNRDECEDTPVVLPWYVVLILLREVQCVNINQADG